MITADGWDCAHLTHSWWSVFDSEEVVAFVAHSCIPVVGIGIPGCPGELVGVFIISMLASANSSGQVRTWQQENGSFTLLHTLKKEQPYSIAFHPDGTVLAVATVNNVYLIDTLSGEELSRIPHKGIVYNVSFSSDGTTMATASLKVIQLWDMTLVRQLRTSDLIKTACLRLIRNFSASEWTVLFGDQTYIPLCENLPVP